MSANPVVTQSNLIARLRAIGKERYHHRHPFHLLMHEGKLTRGQLQAWALNRYYYQSIIPVKDAIILSRSNDPEFRRAWRKRIEDHDGVDGKPGGIERWIQLAVATGLDRAYVVSGDGVLPGVKYSVNAYLELVRERSFLEAVSSSFTELFSGDLIALRLDALKKHYPWLSHGLSYFEKRLSQVPEDIDFAVHWVTRTVRNPEQEELVCRALRAKCDILWAQLDAIYYAYVEPGWPPPGAPRFVDSQ